MWVCLQDVYAVSKVFDVSLRSCKVSAFWYHQEGDMAYYRIGKFCRG